LKWCELACDLGAKGKERKWSSSTKVANQERDLLFLAAYLHWLEVLPLLLLLLLQQNIESGKPATTDTIILTH